MNFSRHAECRLQQRAIPPMVVDLLMHFGAQEQLGNGVVKRFFDKRARKRLKAYAGGIAPLLDAHLDVYAVINPDETVVTVAHRYQRIRRN